MNDQNTVLCVDGIDCCPACASGLLDKLRRMDGVVSVEHPGGGILIIGHTCSVDHIVDWLARSGHNARVTGVDQVAAPEIAATSLDERLPQQDRSHRPATVPAVVSGVTLLTGALLSFYGQDTAAIAACAMAIAAGAWRVGRSAISSLSRGALDIHVLLIIATAGAIALGRWLEAGTLVFLFAVGEALEARAMARAHREIEQLMRLTPSEAVVIRDGMEVRLPPERCHAGDTMIIRPGARIPMDGIVVRGRSAVDSASITGEPLPAVIEPGDSVYAGTFNIDGYLEARVTAVGEETAWHRIALFARDALAQRAVVQSTVDRFARVYTPAVIILAVAVSTVVPLVAGVDARPWLYRGLTLLIVSCPCALVLAAPVALVSSMSRAARLGILVRGGHALERLAGVRVVAFDKTGTLTRGQPEVAGIEPASGVEADTLIRASASVQACSEHLFARAIVEFARSRDLPIDPVEDFISLPGCGVQGFVDGVRWQIGSARWLTEQGVDCRAAQDRPEVVCVAADGVFSGMIAIHDPIRPDARETIERLRAGGVDIVMLTGDNEQSALRVARELGVSDVRWGLLPADKVAAIEQLGAGTAAIGDGINDAAALAAASIGIAMGHAADVTLETADITLLGGDLSRLPVLFALGRATGRVIRQNLALSVLTKVAALLLVVPGWLTLPIAIIADDGTALAVIGNGLRLLGYARKSPVLARIPGQRKDLPTERRS